MSEPVDRVGTSDAANDFVTGLTHLLRPGVDLSHKVILYLEDITVSFDGFKALNDLTLTIDVGELRCVIGPNGAGKTTMMDVITGKTRPDAGTRVLRPDDRPHAACPRPRSPTPASVASSRSRRSSRTTRVRESRAGDEDRQARPPLARLRAGRRDARPHRRDARADPPDRRSRPAGGPALARPEAVARDRHAADAGAASCCCSTSRSPA